MTDINLGVGGANSAVAGGYDIDNSVKTEADNSEWMQRATGGGNDSNVKQHSISAWVKRTELGGTQMILSMANIGRVRFNSSNKIEYQFRAGRNFTTTRVFRDTSAWYHIFVVADTTLATASDRMKLYINGVRETVFDSYTAPDLNHNSPAWGVYNTYNLNFAGKSDDFYNGYIAETFFIGEQSLLPTDFGEFDDDSGIWKPKEYTGTFGSNDTYLDFKDSSNLGNNAAGGADLSLNNITAADQATDTPTNNFCTMNTLDRTNGNIKNQEGATKVTTDGGSGWCSMVATMGVTKGKWYWEAQRMSTGTPNDVITGIVGSEDAYVPYSSAANYYIGNVATSSSIGYYQKNYPSQEGSVVNGVSMNFYSQGGDTIMFGLDMDNGKMYFGLNGTWKGTGDSIGGNTARASTLHDDFDGEFVLPAVSVFQGNNMTINFGGYAAYTISSAASDADGYGTFEYAPPSGYYSLCSKNLAEYG